MVKDYDAKRLIFYINKAKNGDVNSLEKIFKYFDVPLRGMANKYYIPGGDKEDIMQIAKIGLYEGIKSFDEERTSNPVSFLKRCAEIDIKDEVKKVNRDKHKTLGVACSLDVPLDKNDDSSAILGDIIEDDFSVEKFIERKELKKYMREKLYNTMTSLESDVLKLYMEEYSYKEMSEMLSLSSKQIENALRRVRKKIKTNKELNELYFGY